MSHPLGRAGFDEEKRREKPGLKEAGGGKQGRGFTMLHSFTYSCFAGEIALHQEGYLVCVKFLLCARFCERYFPSTVSLVMITTLLQNRSLSPLC